MPIGKLYRTWKEQLRAFRPNQRITHEARAWYQSIAKQWIVAQWQQLGEIRLSVDGAKVGFAHQLLMVSVAYRRRSLPIAWDWVKQVRGHSSAEKQIELLKYVKTLLPKKVVVVLVGDSEFGSIQAMNQLHQWRWYYALRQIQAFELAKMMPGNLWKAL